MNRSQEEPAGAADASGDHGDGIVEFNIHDLIGIRLLNPSPRDVQTVARHLGLHPKSFSGEPGLSIRFVEALPVEEQLCYLGREDVGFTDDAFLLLRSRNLARARAQLALETVGSPCEIICETGLPAIPLLRQLINVTMLAKGIVPVHAAAFRHHDRGVMVTGWSHGSKTGTLLAFMAAGAKFIGDEWIYLSATLDQMYGLPDLLEARPWYLRELPEYERKVSFADRLRTGLAAALASLINPLVDRSERRNSLASKIIRQAHQALVDQQSIHLRPLTLFGQKNCRLASPLDVVIVVVSHDASKVVVEPAPLEQVVGQMAASFLHEQASLISTYHKHLFAFPSRRNMLLDQVERIYRERATEALKGKASHTMRHPYPVSVRALRHAVEPLLTPE